MFSKKLFWLVPLVMLAACGRSGNGEYAKNDYAPSPSPSPDVASADSAVSAADKPLNAPERKIIHTADYHCKVQDVFTATTKLEQLVKSVGGVVQESRMENTNYDTRTSYYTSDSLREARTYTPSSYLTLRVPSAYLDSIVNAIPGMSAFIDSRTLKQSDVTYAWLANVLKNQVGNKQTTSRAMKLARKSHEPIEVQQYDDSRQEQHIDRLLENRNLMDQVNYATLTVAFTQPEQVFVHTIVNTDHVMRTPFLLQCKSALSGGWDMIRAFVVWLMKIWPVVILLIAAWIVYRRVGRRQLVFAKK